MMGHSPATMTPKGALALLLFFLFALVSGEAHQIIEKRVLDEFAGNLTQFLWSVDGHQRGLQLGQSTCALAGTRVQCTIPTEFKQSAGGVIPMQAELDCPFDTIVGVDATRFREMKDCTCEARLTEDGRECSCNICPQGDVPFGLDCSVQPEGKSPYVTGTCTSLDCGNRCNGTCDLSCPEPVPEECFHQCGTPSPTAVPSASAWLSMPVVSTLLMAGVMVMA